MNTIRDSINADITSTSTCCFTNSVDTITSNDHIVSNTLYFIFMFFSVKDT